MAETKVIAATLQVDTGSSNANIKEVNKNLNEVKGNLEQTSATAKKTGATIDNSTGSFGKLKGELSGMPGPLGQAASGVTSLGSAFKALLLNPVGAVLAAIVFALTALYKAFTSTAEGADKVGFIFDGLKGVLLTVRDAILKMAGAFSKFFSGDFKGAFKDGADAVSNFGDKCVDAFNRAYDASKRLDEIQDRMKELDVQQAKINFQIKESKQILNDETASLSDKAKALKVVGDAESKISEERVELAVRELMALQFKNDEQRRLGTLSQEQIDEELAAETRAYNLKLEQSNNKIALQKQGKQLDKQAADQRKTIHDAEIAQGKIELAAKLENQAKLTALQEQDYLKSLSDTDRAIYQLEQKHIKEQELLNKNHADTLLNEQLFREELAKIILNSTEMQVVEAEAATGKRITLDDTLRDKVVQNVDTMGVASHGLAEAQVAWQGLSTNEKLNLIGGELDKFSENIGKQSAIGKATAIASATISTYMSAVSSFNSLSGIPIVGPVLGALAAAAAVASGIATVKKIIAVKVPGGGGGGGAAPTAVPIPAAPVSPTQTSTTIDPNSIKGIGNAASPARAYVLSSDIEQDANRNERLNRAARLG